MSFLVTVSPPCYHPYPGCFGGIHLGFFGASSSSCGGASFFSSGFVSGSCGNSVILMIHLYIYLNLRGKKRYLNTLSSTCDTVSWVFSSLTARCVFFKTGNPAPSPKKIKRVKLFGSCENNRI